MTWICLSTFASPISISMLPSLCSNWERSLRWDKGLFSFAKTELVPSKIEHIGTACIIFWFNACHGFRMLGSSHLGWIIFHVQVVLISGETGCGKTTQVRTSNLYLVCEFSISQRRCSITRYNFSSLWFRSLSLF